MSSVDRDEVERLPVATENTGTVVHLAPAVVVLARREQQRLPSRMRREVVRAPVRQQIRGQPRVIGLSHEQQRIVVPTNDHEMRGPVPSAVRR